jgi:hypothetical protein
MERGIARSLYAGNGFAWLPQPKMELLAACSAALASPDLDPKNWMRRTSLLESRAAHLLAAEDAKAALVELDAAASALPSAIHPGERARSVSLSMNLLRALALAKTGDSAGAVRLIEQAADARPWSDHIQQVAASIRNTIPGGSAAGLRIAERRFLLDEDQRESLARARQAAGDFTGAVADWRQVKPAVIGPTTVLVPMRGVIVNGQPGWPITMIDPARVGTAALAAAFAGDGATARRWIAEAEAAAAAATAPASPTLPKGISGPEFPTVDKVAQAAELARYAALVEAAIVYQSGDVTAARAAVTRIGQVPSAPAAAQAIASITGGITDADTVRPTVDTRLLFAVLPRYEGADALPVASSDDPMRSFLIGGAVNERKPSRNGYSGGGNFFKASGFKSKPMKDGRGITITFIGDASSNYAVEEMALLRAVELAQGAGQAGFIILDKRDYSRTVTVTYGGSPIGDVQPAGYQTELDGAFADGNAGGRVIGTEPLLAALGPFYKRSQ